MKNPTFPLPRSPCQVFCFLIFIYDDGCHLKKFAQNPARRDVTRTAKRLSELSILEDKMHMKGQCRPGGVLLGILGGGGGGGGGAAWFSKSRTSD